MNIQTHANIDPGRHDGGAAARSLPARKKRVVIYGVSLVMDCASLLLGYALALQLREQAWLGTGGLPIIAVALPVFLMCEIAQETQSVESLASRSLAMKRALSALLVTALVVLALSFFLKEQTLSRVGYVVTFVGAAGFIVAAKVIENLIFSRWMEGSATATLVLGDGLPVEPSEGFDFVDVEAMGLWPDLRKPATIDALAQIIAPYDRVIVACRFERRANWATFLKSQDVGGEILLDRDLLHGAVAVGSYGAEDTLVLSRGPLSLANRLQKRAFDLVVAITAVLLLSPVLIAAAILIRIEDGGPVFFRQVRVGRANRQFRILKFRTMSVAGSDADGAVSASRGDHRVTRIGRILRRTSIDELPQLFNVIRGHMSIVGPRPHALGSLAGDELFWEADGNYWIRHALKPGITGLAQVRGYRGATDTADSLRQRVRSDLEYLTNWSLTQDVLIILRTLRVLVHDNAF
ncbi:exopolysaccharide biosynthesis polyprenyl glycosylphosphotransferase [Tsuneonella sp. HG249]